MRPPDAPVGLRPGLLNLLVLRGDEFRERLVWKDANGDPLDITGWVLEGQLREAYGGALLANFVLDDVGLPDNEVNLRLADTDTAALGEGVFPWDLVRVSGGPSSPRTVLSGVAVVRPRATDDA